MDEENNENTYLFFTSTDKNKEVLTKYTELWNRMRHLVEAINGTPREYGKDFLRIKLNLDNNLPLINILNLHNLIAVVRSVSQEDKYYPKLS